MFTSTANVYQPDIIFIAAERITSLIKDGKIKGAPDLIVEVLSLGKKLDKTVKKAVYEQTGVKEYWIVAPSSKKVTGFQLIEGRYV